MEELHKLGVRVSVVSVYDMYMCSFSVIARDRLADITRRWLIPNDAVWPTGFVIKGAMAAAVRMSGHF